MQPDAQPKPPPAWIDGLAVTLFAGWLLGMTTADPEGTDVDLEGGRRPGQQAPNLGQRKRLTDMRVRRPGRPRAVPKTGDRG